MIKSKYLIDCNGAERFGTCASCGKNSGDDSKMIRLIFLYNDNHKTSLCLCDDCKRLLYKII